MRGGGATALWSIAAAGEACHGMGVALISLLRTRNFDGHAKECILSRSILETGSDGSN